MVDTHRTRRQDLARSAAPAPIAHLRPRPIAKLKH